MCAYTLLLICRMMDETGTRSPAGNEGAAQAKAGPWLMQSDGLLQDNIEPVLLSVIEMNGALGWRLKYLSGVH